jgi:hypothetical protein
MWVDWDWDIPGVTLPLLVFLGVAAARPAPSEEANGAVSFPGPAAPRVAGLMVGGVALALLGVSALLPALARQWTDEALRIGASGKPEDVRRADEKAAAARRIDPFSLDPVIASANLARRDGDLRRTMRIVAEGVERQPNNPQIWQTLGELQVAADDLRGATRSYHYASILDPFANLPIYLILTRGYDDSRSASATGTPLPTQVLPPPIAAPAPIAPTAPTTPAPTTPAPTPQAPAPAPAPRPAPAPAPSGQPFRLDG